MNNPELLASVVSLLLGILGYFLRDAHSRIKESLSTIEELRHDLNHQRLIMASDYVRRNELKEIEVKLDAFSEALFGKIDTLTQRVDHRLGVLADRVDMKIQGVQDKFEKRIDDISNSKQDKPK